MAHREASGHQEVFQETRVVPASARIRRARHSAAVLADHVDQRVVVVIAVALVVVVAEAVHQYVVEVALALSVKQKPRFRSS